MLPSKTNSNTCKFLGPVHVLGRAPTMAYHFPNLTQRDGYFASVHQRILLYRGSVRDV